MSQSKEPESTTQPDKSKPAANALSAIGRITAYGPLAITIVILVVQTFIPTAIEALPIQATAAILAGSVVFLAWHLETTLLSSTRALRGADERIGELEETQKAFIEATTSISQAKLGTTFAEVCKTVSRIGFLRVYAISSQQILSFLKFHDLSVDKCHVLLRGFDPKDVNHRDFLNQIRLVVADWQRLNREGRITELEIRHYDFHPTEYECIFDRDYLILGLYDSDPDDYSEVSVRDPVLIRGTSDAGRLTISEFSERFDRLFEICAKHHGPNVLET